MAEPPGALEGLRVLDWSTSVSGAWCSRQLADLGADVIAVEPPGGHPVRQLAPVDDEGRGIPGQLLFANKRTVTLDRDTAEGQSLARRLAAAVDVIVSSDTPGALQSRGLRYEDLDVPALVMAHVTPHGMTGELAEAPGNDLTAAARSGWASINGLADGPPLKPSGWQASYCTGTAAAAAIVAALLHRDRSGGEGQELDVAEVDVMVSTFAPALLRSLYQGAAQQRRADIDITAGPVPVADGYFALTISRAHFWRDAMNLLGLPDLAEDPRWETSWYRQQHKDEYVSRVQEAMRAWRKADLFDELAVRRVVAGPVLTMEELHQNDHLRARRFWVLPVDASGGPEFPGAPFKMSGTPWRLEHAAAQPGAHTEKVLDEISEGVEP